MKTRIFAAIAAIAVATGAADSAAAQTAVSLSASIQAVAVTPSFLVGRWTDTGDCSNAVDFFADGTFRTTGGAAGRWTLVGDRLSFIGQRTVTAQVRAGNRDSITLTHDDGSVGSSTRCGAQAPASRLPAVPATVAEALRISRPASRAFLFGRWSDTGDCSDTIEFFRDGRFAVRAGTGTWTLVGERLTFRGATTVGARLRAVGRDRILLIHDDATIGQSVRC